jgi:hypothetical protein
MVRGSYSPTKRRSSPEESRVVKFLDAVKRGELTREELLTGYFSLVYSRSGSYRAAGRLLGIDWRTVKELVDVELVRQFAAELE